MRFLNRYALFSMLLELFYFSSSGVNSSVTECYFCKECTNPTQNLTQECNSKIGKDFCYVSLRKDGTYNQGCASLSFDESSYNATGKCHTDNCNHPTLSCLACSKCETPTTSNRILCTGKQNTCYAGIRLSDEKYDQGCTPLGNSLALYSITGFCQTNDCNFVKNICYFSYNSPYPTKFGKVICTGQNSMCYVGLSKTGMYDQGCQSGNFLMTTYSAYLDCDTDTCNYANLGCYYCEGCQRPTLTQKVLCESSKYDSCYVTIESDGLYYQGCHSSQTTTKTTNNTNVLDGFECKKSYCNQANLSCYECNQCDNSSISQHVKICKDVKETSCYVSLLKNGTYNQGCSTSSFDLKPYNATGKCDVDNCNHPNLSCLGCSKCVTPTTSHRVLCTGKQKKCFIGLDHNGKYEQGCSNETVQSTSYSAFVDCDTDNCNLASLICYHCDGCKRPTTVDKVLCESGKYDSCYVRLGKDGLYYQGCHSSNKTRLKMSVIATIECQESYCNAANLSCYDCNKCDKSSISKQVKICTGLNETSCYTALNHDGTIDQGCLAVDRNFNGQFKANLNCIDSLCNLTTKKCYINNFSMLLLPIILFLFN